MNSFRADIVIDEQGNLTGKVYDLDLEEEYQFFRMENQNGAFTNSLRAEYKKILEDIKAHCFINNYFLTEQANRITKRIKDLYQDEPIFPWQKYSEYGIFKNPLNGKWYSVIMNIDKSKLDKNTTGDVEILNVKLEKEMITNLLKEKPFYKAYHMNKENWITILLDDSLSDEEIMKYIDISHKYTISNKTFRIN